jgi:mediator of RNA polymerase II transcription subunit 7
VLITGIRGACAAYSMADPNEQLSQKAIASQFPNPPPFWKQFSADNIARLDQIRTEQALKNGTTISGLPVRTLGVPDDLVNLQPPAEPVQGTWRVLGGAYSVRQNRWAGFVFQC